MPIKDRYYFKQSNIAEAKANFNACQKICSSALSKTAVTLGDNEFCLAELSFALNDAPEAIAHAKRSIKIFKACELEADDKWRLS
jgi:tetratricopeptide (TPR) repeat protein